MAYTHATSANLKNDNRKNHEDEKKKNNEKHVGRMHFAGLRNDFCTTWAEPVFRKSNPT